MSLRTGKLGRLNMNGSEEVVWHPAPMPRPRGDVDDVFQGLKWRVARAGLEQNSSYHVARVWGDCPGSGARNS